MSEKKKPAVVAKRPRSAVFTKEDLVERFQENLRRKTGLSLSKTQTWELFKIAFYTAFEIPTDDKNLSLSGVGTFKRFYSGRSGNLKMKYVVSDSINDASAEHAGHIFETLMKLDIEEVEEAEEETKSPKKKATKSPKKKATKSPKKKSKKPDPVEFEDEEFEDEEFEDEEFEDEESEETDADETDADEDDDETDADEDDDETDADEIEFDDEFDDEEFEDEDFD